MKRNIITIAIAGAILALVGTTGAVAAVLITSADIQDGTIRGKDLRPGLVDRFSQPGPAGADGTDGVDGVDGTNGTNGTNGIDGTDGVDGQDGEDGAPGLANVRADEPYVHTIPANSVGVAFTECPEAGQVALGGGFRLNGFAAEAFQGGGSAVDVTAIASEAVGIEGGAVVNTYQNPAFQQTERGSFQPNGWAVTVQNDSDQAQDVRVSVVCATVG
jgi:hypothetical protein